MSAQPCVFIVDDDEAVREGLEMVLETAGLTCRTFVSAEHFLDSYDPGAPGCLVLDINMPGIHGDDLQAELNRQNIRLPIIFLTSYGDIPISVRTIKAGAVDFLTKPVQINQLLERIKAELEHEMLRLEKNKGELDFHKRLDSLTPREQEILPLAIEGIANKEIGKQMNISYRTVEFHRTQILKKTGTNNFLELARLFEINRVSFDPKQQNM
jgi:two-component system, LuxR family, response regulator FixJ